MPIENRAKHSTLFIKSKIFFLHFHRHDEKSLTVCTVRNIPSSCDVYTHACIAFISRKAKIDRKPVEIGIFKLIVFIAREMLRLYVQSGLASL